MKQANIQITFEEEKLRALRRYIAKRDSTLEAELQKAAQRLYEKVVPAAVQELLRAIPPPLFFRWLLLSSLSLSAAIC